MSASQRIRADLACVCDMFARDVGGRAHFARGALKVLASAELRVVALSRIYIYIYLYGSAVVVVVVFFCGVHVCLASEFFVSYYTRGFRSIAETGLLHHLIRACITHSLIHCIYMYLYTGCVGCHSQGKCG